MERGRLGRRGTVSIRSSGRNGSRLSAFLGSFIYYKCTKGIRLEALKHAGVNPNDGQNCRSPTIKICVYTQGRARHSPHFPPPPEGCGRPWAEAALASGQRLGRQQLWRASVATCSVQTVSSGMLTPNTSSSHGLMEHLCQNYSPGPQKPAPALLQRAAPKSAPSDMRHLPLSPGMGMKSMSDRHTDHKPEPDQTSIPLGQKVGRRSRAMDSQTREQ